MKSRPRRHKPSDTPVSREFNGGRLVFGKTAGRTNRALSWLMLAGLVASVGLMVAGAVLAGVGRGGIVARESFLEDLPGALASLEPWGLFILGLLVLLATPIFRVVATFLLFLRRRVWWSCTVSAIVLCIIALSVVLGLRG